MAAGCGRRGAGGLAEARTSGPVCTGPCRTEWTNLYVAQVPFDAILLPTKPDAKNFEKAFAELVKNQFLTDEKCITILGEKVLQIPLNDLSLAKAYAEAEKISALSIALFSILDADEMQSKERTPLNALELARDLTEKGNRLSREIRLAHKRLLDYAKENDRKKFSADNSDDNGAALRVKS